MRHLVRINNQNRNRRINRKGIKKAALRTLRSFAKSDTLIDITFVGDRRIRALNKRYMGRNRSTDVLAFSLGDGAGARAQRKMPLVGDIYISSDRAAGNAKRFNTGYAEELMLYTVHGILHLLGFGDKSRKERERIRGIEERLLNETAKVCRKS